MPDKMKIIEERKGTKLLARMIELKCPRCEIDAEEEALEREIEAEKQSDKR